MATTDPLRGRDELLELLELRRRAFRQLPHDTQKTVNMTRLLDVDDMHQLLDHYLQHGHCADETVHGRLIGWAAAA